MNSRETAESLLVMTQDIEYAARLADWPTAARLTEQRAPLLMSVNANVDEATLAILRRIQDIDTAVMQLAATSREELDLEYNKAMRSARVTSEYHRVAAF
jgi:flagellar protein FliT